MNHADANQRSNQDSNHDPSLTLDLERALDEARTSYQNASYPSDLPAEMGFGSTALSDLTVSTAGRGSLLFGAWRFRTAGGIGLAAGIGLVVILMVVMTNGSPKDSSDSPESSNPIASAPAAEPEPIPEPNPNPSPNPNLNPNPDAADLTRRVANLSPVVSGPTSVLRGFDFSVWRGPASMRGESRLARADSTRRVVNISRALPRERPTLGAALRLRPFSPAGALRGKAGAFDPNTNPNPNPLPLLVPDANAAESSDGSAVGIHVPVATT